MPGETLVLAGGFLAGKGVFDLDALIVTVSIAAIVGDSYRLRTGTPPWKGLAAAVWTMGWRAPKPS
jgi:hypothetical protein